MSSMESMSSEETLKKSDASAVNLCEEPTRKHYTQQAMSRTLKLLLRSLKYVHLFFFCLILVLTLKIIKS